MGKRFGRNRRRKLESKIEELKCINGSLEQHIDYIKLSTEPLVDTLNSIREKLCKDSVFVPVENQYLLERPLTYHDIVDSSDCFVSCGDIEQQSKKTFVRQMLYNLLMDIDKRPEYYDSKVHFNFTLEKGNYEVSTASYSVSEDALENTSYFFIENVMSKEITKMLLSVIKESHYKC